VKPTGRRSRAWKPPRPTTPRDLIGRIEEDPAPPRLGTPTLSAFHRLSKH
jgi:hypothetical protein